MLVPTSAHIAVLSKFKAIGFWLDDFDHCGTSKLIFDVRRNALATRPVVFVINIQRCPVIAKIVCVNHENNVSLPKRFVRVQVNHLNAKLFD